MNGNSINTNIVQHKVKWCNENICWPLHKPYPLDGLIRSSPARCSSEETITLLRLPATYTRKGRSIMDFDSCSMEATATEAMICELCKFFLLPSPCSSSYGNIMDIIVFITISEEDYYYSYGDAYHDAISYPRTIAVLSCSHVYHADCLEKTTPPANVCDPKCPLLCICFSVKHSQRHKIQCQRITFSFYFLHIGLI